MHTRWMRWGLAATFTLALGAVGAALTAAPQTARFQDTFKVDISCETRDGKAVKLPKPVTHFAAEITKDTATSEVIVTPDGAPVKD